MMAETENYNGWTNYETWCANLWLENEEGSYRYWIDRAIEIRQQAKPSSYLTAEEEATIELADELREALDTVPEGVSGLYADLLTTALGAVNWREIAATMLEDNVE